MLVCTAPDVPETDLFESTGHYRVSQSLIVHRANLCR